MDVPKFNLSNSMLNEADFNTGLADLDKSSSKGFEPGNYNVKITDIGYHKNKDTGSINCSGDESWFNVVVTLQSADGRVKKNYIQVPTRSPFYKGKGGKETLFPFKKLQEFLAGMGMYLDYHNYTKVIPKLFGDESALAQLMGEELSIDIGYTGPHAKYVEQGKYQLVIQGKPYEEAGVVKEFPDRDAVKLFAAVNLNKPNVQTFPEITKTHAKPERKEAKKADTAW